MKDILTQLLFAVLTICAPLATAYVRKAAAAINASTAEKIKNETIQRICCEITDAVADAVAAMNQTYVNGAISAAIKSLSSDALDYIKKISGDDTVGYLTTRIQAQIDHNKTAKTAQQ